MAKYKNCPNCAAPYDPALSKCPYCGTIYFDMSVIDFDHHEPFWLKIRVNECEITQFVVPEVGEIETNYDEVYAYGGHGNNRIMIVKGSPDISTNISFHTICPPDSEALITMTKMNGGTKE